eukprot:s360_g13.t1
MLEVNVSFPSGRGGSVSLPATSTLRDLKILAQNCLGQGFLRLVKGDGSVLTNSMDTLLHAGIQDGEHLTAVAQQAKVSRSGKAFAVWCYKGDGIVTWGDPSDGADSSAVRDQLKHVEQIQVTSGAFAAVLADGSVVAWGDPNYGGDCSAFQDQLRNVREIKAASEAFAAILADGSVITWGRFGADNFAIQNRPRNRPRNVKQIQATNAAFAAILADGSVATWGHPGCGGDSTAVQDRLKNVKQIQATLGAFAAILADGSVVTWGHPSFGGDSASVISQLRNVRHIQRTLCAFAAILADGSVVSWGSPNADCHMNHAVGVGPLQLPRFNPELMERAIAKVKDQLCNVQKIQATSSAFAAILADGSVISWGDANVGGDCSLVQDRLKNVEHIQATYAAFGAILADGSVVTWGDRGFGGKSSVVQDQLRNVRQIQSTFGAFAAILADGSVVTWGDPTKGGDSSAVQGELRNVQDVQATSYAFAAILADGSEHRADLSMSDRHERQRRWEEEEEAERRFTELPAPNLDIFGPPSCGAKMLGAAGATVAAGYAATAFTYNRDRFHFNAKQRQHRIHQNQSMKLELWKLFREDVRDLFELTTSNMNTYMVVGSLLVTCIIGFIFVGYQEFPMEPPWLLLIWNNSVFSAITFGILSVWLATHGSSSSNSAATKILTQAVRPPVPGLTEEQYEKSGVKNFFMPPAFVPGAKLGGLQEMESPGKSAETKETQVAKRLADKEKVPVERESRRKYSEKSQAADLNKENSCGR